MGSINIWCNVNESNKMKQDDEDLYAVLGVSQTASKSDIRAAYLAKAKLLHPDKTTNINNSTANDDFKRINLAHEILGNDSKRRQYDIKLGTDKSTERYYASWNEPVQKRDKFHTVPGFIKRRHVFFFFKLSVLMSCLIYKSCKDALELDGKLYVKIDYNHLDFVKKDKWFKLCFLDSSDGFEILISFMQMGLVKQIFMNTIVQWQDEQTAM